MNEIMDRSKKDRKTIASVIIAAITASICCVGPLLLIGLGISGAWIGNITLLEPLRPYLMLLTLGILGYAFYKIYNKHDKKCEPGSYCANPRSDRINKITLWISTIFVLALLSVPYVAEEWVARENENAVKISSQFTNYKEVTLDVPGMNCASCPLTVQKSLDKLEGVISVKVTFNDKRAVVQYNPSKVTQENLITATTNAGYPSNIYE